MNAVSVLLFTETMSISELVLGKLQPSFSITQESDCTNDLGIPALASWVSSSAPFLLRALLPISLLLLCVSMDRCCLFIVPLILIGVFRSWTADDLVNLINDEDLGPPVHLLDIDSECSDPEACSEGCFLCLELRKRSSEKTRDGKPPRWGL